VLATLIVGLLALQAPAQTAAPAQTSSATTTLISLYDSAKDSDTKETILRHLGERGDAKAKAKLLAIAQGESDSDLRDAAIRQIAKE